MTLLEETIFRYQSCVDGTNEGWGDKHSLRNHMNRVNRRISELVGLYNEIEALPAEHELRADETIVELMQEYRDLVTARAECEVLLDGVQRVHRVETPEKPRDLKPTLKKLGFPT
jgi:hypothetical protein